MTDLLNKIKFTRLPEYFQKAVGFETYNRLQYFKEYQDLLDFTEADNLEFAARVKAPKIGKKITQKGGRVITCDPAKTYPCGNVCRGQDKPCKNPIEGQAKTYIEFLKLQTGGKQAPAKDGAKPKYDVADVRKRFLDGEEMIIDQPNGTTARVKYVKDRDVHYLETYKGDNIKPSSSPLMTTEEAERYIDDMFKPQMIKAFGDPNPRFKDKKSKASLDKSDEVKKIKPEKETPSITERDFYTQKLNELDNINKTQSKTWFNRKLNDHITGIQQEIVADSKVFVTGKDQSGKPLTDKERQAYGQRIDSALKQLSTLKDRFSKDIDPDVVTKSYLLDKGGQSVNEYLQERYPERKRLPKFEADTTTTKPEKEVATTAAKETKPRNTNLITDKGEKIPLSPQEIKVLTGRDKLSASDKTILSKNPSIVMLSKRIAETGDDKLMRKWEGRALVPGKGIDSSIAKEMLKDIDDFEAGKGKTATAAKETKPAASTSGEERSRSTGKTDKPTASKIKSYEDAAKTPEGGWTKGDADNKRATISQGLASLGNGLPSNPKVFYDWSVKHGIDLEDLISKQGKKLTKKAVEEGSEESLALMKAVYEDKPLVVTKSAASKSGEERSRSTSKKPAKIKDPIVSSALTNNPAKIKEEDIDKEFNDWMDKNFQWGDKGVISKMNIGGGVDRAEILRRVVKSGDSQQIADALPQAIVKVGRQPTEDKTLDEVFINRLLPYAAKHYQKLTPEQKRKWANDEYDGFGDGFGGISKRKFEQFASKSGVHKAIAEDLLKNSGKSVNFSEKQFIWDRKAIAFYRDYPLNKTPSLINR